MLEVGSSFCFSAQMREKCLGQVDRRLIAWLPVVLVEFIATTADALANYMRKVFASPSFFEKLGKLAHNVLPSFTSILLFLPSFLSFSSLLLGINLD